jgi:hypothetical protein
VRVGLSGEERLHGGGVHGVLGAFERVPDAVGAVADLEPPPRRDAGLELDGFAGAAAPRQEARGPGGGDDQLIFLGCNVFRHACP